MNNPHFVSLSAQTVLTVVIITFEKTRRTLKLLCFVWKEADSPLKHLWNKCTVSVLASQWILSHMSQSWSFLHLFYTNSFLLTGCFHSVRSVLTAIYLRNIDIQITKPCEERVYSSEHHQLCEQLFAHMCSSGWNVLTWYNSIQTSVYWTIARHLDLIYSWYWHLSWKIGSQVVSREKIVYFWY